MREALFLLGFQMRNLKLESARLKGETGMKIFLNISWHIGTTRGTLKRIKE
jgi:hypothetical protein